MLPFHCSSSCKTSPSPPSPTSSSSAAATEVATATNAHNKTGNANSNGGGGVRRRYRDTAKKEALNQRDSGHGEEEEERGGATHHLRQNSQVSTDTSLSSLSSSSSGRDSGAKFRNPADQLVTELFETIKAKKSPQQVFTMSSFPQQHDSPAAPGSISTLKQIWEADSGKPGKSKSNIYAAPSEVNAPGILSVAQSKSEIYADLNGILSGADDLLKSLLSAAKLSGGRGGGRQDKASLLSLADEVEAFRNYATLYADNVCATGRFRFRAQLNRMAQMVKEIVFLANRSPHHAAKPIIEEVEDITRDLILLARKK